MTWLKLIVLISKYRGYALTEACLNVDFFCELVTQSSGDQKFFQLKRSHPYHCQVQGQMAITERAWYDFVVYTSKGITIDRITFDKLC